MGADNWAVCPKCKSDHSSKAERTQLELKEAYGKVAPTEYLKMVQKSSAEPALDNTLREDFEVGISSIGRFEIYYKGQCDICGFQFEHTHTENALK